jgi:signal transduction histidine kinase
VNDSGSWAALHRGLVTTLAIALAIALLLTALDGGGFLIKLIYSLSVSLCCWLVLDGGRHVLAEWLTYRARRKDNRAAQRNISGVRLLPVAVVAAVIGPAAGLALGDLATGLQSPRLGDWDNAAVRLTFGFAVAGTAVAMVVGALADRLARSEIQAQVAQREAAEYELKLLQAQLEPHMLFNTLANLRILIHADPQAAQQMLDRLIAFLRAMLASSRTQVHSLAQEFARLDDYLALMRVRMGQRLQVRLDLPDALRETFVPPLLLQPLVENAIRHGLEPHVGPGRIEVAAQRDGARLILTVRDTGAGLAPTFSPGGSHFGLEQVRRRLRSLYGDAAALTLAPAPDNDGGTLATVMLPCPDPVQ